MRSIETHNYIEFFATIVLCNGVYTVYTADSEIYRAPLLVLYMHKNECNNVYMRTNVRIMMRSRSRTLQNIKLVEHVES